ncbi:TNFAIP3-interacting protein 1-like [Stegastes partitus]|uniref:TNFAIP3-interacting protein 1-like n=1 Tax=Stegastes partitus TaxID=144197 RepID=A0A9Y4U3J2_9TELE|nr:PREDICTED: TNFAIP3-interacting protein 1-like [Stegastes partitus]
MSLLENSADRMPSKPAATKPAHRLYPSLPNIDRYEFCLPVGSSGPDLHPELQPESLPEDAPSEGSSPGSDVRMKAQILLLEEQRKELLSINERWAKEYRTMVRYYKEKVQALKALQQHQHYEEGEKQATLYKKIQFKMAEDNTQTGEVSCELLRAEKEAEELRVQNVALTRRGRHQHEEIRRLNKALQEAQLQSSSPLDGSSETLEDLWKHQAEVYKEDFLRERKDREKLKDKYLELEKKFKKVHNELHVHKSQVTPAQQPQPLLQCACTNKVKCADWEVRPVKQHHIQLQRRYTLDNK